MADTLFPVAAPPAAAPPTGLLVSVPVLPGTGDEYRQGITYTPETSGGWRALSLCNAQATADHEDPGALHRVNARAVYLEFADPCLLTVARDSGASEARLRRIIDAQESAALALELWSGELSHAEEAADDELAISPRFVDVPADHVLNGGAAVSPQRAVGLLQAAVIRAGGGRPFLHLPIELEPHLSWLNRTGNLLETNTGSLVVVDGGYPGTGPAGTGHLNGSAPAAGTVWAYATSRVQVWREADVHVEETYDPAHNRVHLTGARAYVPAFDPAYLFAVPVTLP